jgi:lambda family phage portal protein
MKTPAIPPQNFLDKAIAYVAPRAAAKRLQSRMALTALGAYNGASFSRPGLAGWSPRASDAESDINCDLPTLRARSRDLGRNAPIAGGAINTMVTNVIGTGLTLQPQPDREVLGLSDEAAEAWGASARREWCLWSESRDCDITRTQNFYELQALIFRSALESGDVFVVLPDVEARPGSPYTLALQVIEADRVCNPGLVGDTQKIAGGVELDENGAPIAYHVCRQHPGSLLRRSEFKWDRIPAFGATTGRRNVLHLFDKRRPGQTRGVPILAPVIEPLKQLQRYTDAELQAAVISGLFAVFVKMDPEAFQDLFDQDGKSAYLQSAMGWDGTVNGSSMDAGGGKAVNLLPGEDIESANPGRPNAAFDPFVQAILRQVGALLELPFEILIKHYTSSYTAARAAMLDAWRFFRGRRDWIASGITQPVYETLLAEAVSRGRIAAPGYFADPAIRKAWCSAAWIGDGPGSVDPQKEVGAAKERIELGISTRAAESILHDGGDWRAKHKQLVEENKARQRDGLGAVAPAAAPAEPDEDDAEADGTPPPRRGRITEALLAMMGSITALAARDSHDPAMVAALDRLSAAATEPRSTVIHTETVNYERGEIRNEIHVPQAAAPDVNVTLEAVMPEVRTPSVTVNSAPAQVVMAHPTEARQTVERDSTSEIVATVTRYSYEGKA